MIRLLVALALLFCSPAWADSPPPSTAKIFIMMGQSNPEGRAPLSGAPSITNGSRIWVYKYDGTWDNDPSEPIADKTGTTYTVFNSPDAPLLGPGRYFADKYAALHSGDDIAIIPCTKGATKITSWAQSSSTSTLYGACKARWQQALTDTGGSIAGIFYYQGESDGRLATDVHNWPSRFTTLLADLRSDIGNANLPVVFVQIGHWPETFTDEERCYWYGLEYRQAALSIANTYMVSAIGLTTNIDGYHLDQAGVKAIGERAADAMP